MAIKLLVNGFFRSGTTIVWKILKDSNPDTLVFYEPCHELLDKHLDDFKRKPCVDETHGIKVWEEYFEVEGLIDKIKQSHPNLGKGRMLPENVKDTLSYVSIFDNLDKDTVLQTNRWSFYLKEIAQSTKLHTVHIVRNPFDVYASIMGIYFNQGSTPKRMLKKKLEPLFINKAFGLGNIYKHTFEHCDGPARGWDSPSKLLVNNKPFDTFLITWTMANYHALAATQETNGTFVSHESIVCNPEILKATLKERAGLAFEYKNALKCPKRNLYATTKELNFLSSKADELNIGVELQQILDNIR